jgi:hypothetical protein
LSNQTGTVQELLYLSSGIGTAKNTFTTEVTVNDTTGMGVQAKIPANFWLANNNQTGVAVMIHAVGSIASTVTPTFTPTIRLGTAGSITGPIVLGAPAALTTVSSTASFWELWGFVQMITRGTDGGANSTVRGVGRIHSPGFFVPLTMLWGGAASPGTVATVEPSIDNYINLNWACNTSSVSNQVQVFELDVHGLN